MGRSRDRDPRRVRGRDLRVLALSLGVLSGAGCESGARPDTLAVATAGTGGVYYILGGAMAERWSRELPGHHVVAEVTGGSVENLNLLLRGDVHVAFSMGTNAHQAYHATGPFEGRDAGRIRVLAALYPNALHLVTRRDSEVRTVADLRGRRVSVGAPGSGTEVAARTILEAAGLGPDDLRAQRLNFNETANALRDGQVDAGFWSVGPPTSSIVDLATARPIRLVPVGDAAAEHARTLDPTLRFAEIPAGAYPGQDEPVATLSTPNVLVVRDDFPDELAHALVRSLFDGVDALAGVHPLARRIGADYTLEASPVPLHPGTVRYLTEQGHTVPAPLIHDG